ncbi:MAG: alanine:cation symporter family protein [Candidatus Zixiibacteriota bacterium]|nr:MAG: alanine:cation symporter family protein [candidate division Zixibacteria bacterium]
MRHAFQILSGKFDKKTDPGEISHFQALSSALSATLGMGNIAGVAVAISVGGPGSIFWMWVAGLVGMSTKFYTCTLATMFRKKDEAGIDQGGPMYYLEVGLGKRFKPLAIMFAVCGMIGCLSLFQVNQLSELIETDYQLGKALLGLFGSVQGPGPAGLTDFEVGKLLIGLVCMILVGVVILGGIKRVGKVAAKVVPAMSVIYFVSALIIVLSNFADVPGLLLSIITNAFGSQAVVGGAAGLAITRVIGTGVKRAAFSNEAGVGTAPMAHGAAKTKEPIREGLIAMLGPFLDTNIVCTLTALVILSSGLLSGVALEGDAAAVVLTADAFTQAMGMIGRYMLTLIIVLFSVSTMISYSYYSLKCSKYLFGNKIGSFYVYIYLISLPVAAVLSATTVINIIDTCFALMAIPTLTGALLLSGRVNSALKDYFKRMGL